MTSESSPLESIKISLPWKWKPVKRMMLPGCDLFSEGDTAMRLSRKLIPLDHDHSQEDRQDSNVQKTIPCSVIGCSQTFTSLLSYENHYNSVHRNVCLTCHRTFPSCFLLDLHIEENHDPVFSILVTKQNMYKCLVESCTHKFTTPDDRRHHMIKTHRYPANFRFHRLHSRKKPALSKSTATNMDTDSVPCDQSQTTTSQENGSVTSPHFPSSLTPRHPTHQKDTSHQKDNSISVSAYPASSFLPESINRKENDSILASKPASCFQTCSESKQSRENDSVMSSDMSAACDHLESTCNQENDSFTSLHSSSGRFRSDSTSNKENAITGVEGREGQGEEGMEVCGAEKSAPRRVFVHKVPQNFSFGHGVSRGFHRPPGKKKTKKKGGHWHQRVGDESGETTTNIENVDMKDMADALGDTL